MLTHFVLVKLLGDAGWAVTNDGTIRRHGGPSHGAPPSSGGNAADLAPGSRLNPVNLDSDSDKQGSPQGISSPDWNAGWDPTDYEPNPPHADSPNWNAKWDPADYYDQDAPDMSHQSTEEMDSHWDRITNEFLCGGGRTDADFVSLFFFFALHK